MPTKALTYVELDIPNFGERLGFAATRARWLTESTGTKNVLNAQSGHMAWTDISELYVYVQNSRNSPVNILNDFLGEVGLGASATVKVSVEYPIGVTYTQFLFSGSATATVLDKQIKRSDLLVLPVTIPRGEVFIVRQFWSNPNGVFYNNWQDSMTYFDKVHASATGDSPAQVDLTMGGTIVDNTGWSFPPAAIIAMTTLPSVGVVGDSIGYGNVGPTGGEAAPYIGDTGVIAKSIAATVPFQNLSACGAGAYAGAASNRYWISSGQPRRELIQYCTQIACQLGINTLDNADGGGGRTGLQLVDDLVAFWQALIATYGLRGTIVQATLPPHESSSTDGYLTTAEQVPNFETAERIVFNGEVREVLPLTLGSYDVAAVLESDVNSGFWRIDGGINFLPNSDTFSLATWFVSQATLTNGFADPAGGNAAFKLVENNAAGPHYTSDVNLASPSGTYTFTVRAKFVDRRLELRAAGASGDFVYVVFDLSGAQIGTTGSSGTHFTLSSQAITSLGSGWFLCRMTFACTENIGACFLVLDNGTGTAALSQAYVGNSVGSCIFYGPQLEHGSSDTNYSPLIPIALTDDGLHPNNRGYQLVVDSETIVSLVPPTFRFSKEASYLPLDIDAIPSIKDVKFDPATVSLGANLGKRATLTVTFSDHRHIFDGEAYSSGTFWGKFRARYGLKLRGFAMRLIQGYLGQTLEEMETRHFVIESSSGPNFNGEYQIIAKDVLKFADGDRSQAPLLSNGFLLNDITNVAGTLTLSPSGIGSEYPASGAYAAIGGQEIVFFTRAGDTVTITRAQYNTEAKEHTAGDRFQLCLRYEGVDVADIIRDLLVTYANVPSSYIPLTAWQAESSGFLGIVYTALIAEPTAVNTLISELVEQAALALWWDDLGRNINLQVLRQIATAAATFTEDLIMDGSLDIDEQPDKRISQVYTYFGKINPLVKEDQVANYRSTAYTSDPTADLDYGTPAIKKIFSRWIPGGGRSIALVLNNKQLGRYRDPPRQFKFDLFRYTGADGILGQGYQLTSWPLQLVDGSPDSVPIQVTRVLPAPDKMSIEAEEALFTPFGGDVDPGTRTIIFDANENNINLRTRHDELYPAPQSGDVVSVTINEGVIIGSTSPLVPAMDVGTWPGGVSITLTIVGKIQGRGGPGGVGGVTSFTLGLGGQPGSTGGTALYTRQSIFMTDVDGAIWGGGGGGGGGGAITDGSTFGNGGGGGGGGAGTQGGASGPGGFGTSSSGGPGDPGTELAGGGGGGVAAPAGHGGAGGGPALSGSAGIPAGNAAGAGGGPGKAIDGVSFIITVGSAGDRRGAQVN